MTKDEIIEETIGIVSWLEQESKEIGTSANYEKLPALKLEEGKITEIEIDFSKPFEKWIDNTKTPPLVKKIIPVTHNKERKAFWLNVKNPLYSKLIDRGKNGQQKFKIIKTGQQKETKFVMVD